MTLELTIGADPEVFVRRGNTFVSAHIFHNSCGSKRNPTKTKHGFVQVDGMALEFNVTPSRTKQEFIDNVTNCFTDLAEIVASRGGHDFQLDPIPSVRFDPDYLEGLPDAVKVLGCNPDFDGSTGQMNPAPDGSTNIRTGAGHIHFGFTHVKDPFNKKHFEECCKLATHMDYFLGLDSLYWDHDQIRRSMYGMPSAFRPKTYGMEYRTPSNRWLEKQETIGRVFDLAKGGYRAFREGWHPYEYHGTFAKTAINEHWVDWEKVNPTLARKVADYV